MGKKIFVSYKYSDDNVESLPGKGWFASTTVRDYVDKFEDILTEEDDIYKGESDGEDLSHLSEYEIEERLKKRIYDSSVTIVFVSKGMKESRSENKQWIPWEVCYSMKEITRGGRTSLANAVLIVVLPDENGRYDYFMTYNDHCKSNTLNTDFLFPILRKNMFNKTESDTKDCNGNIIHYGYSSYIHSVKWENFIDDYKQYIDIAVAINSNKEEYELCKRLED